MNHNAEVVALNIPITITFLAYALIMLGIGFYFFKKNETTQDFFLGNRKMGPIISALSAGASDMSGWLLMGLPGALYVGGFIEGYIAIGLIIGATFNWLFVAKRLRIYTSIIADSITIPDYFETRFNDKQHILRVLCAMVILVFFIFYISSGLVGGAKLFEATFDLNYEYALTIGTLIIVIYTFFGGYRAVCWTDLIQGLLMMGALMSVAAVMLYKIGGLNEAYKYIAQSDSSRTHIAQYQAKIPEILTEIQANPALTYQILSPLIKDLEQSKDLEIKSQNNPKTTFLIDSIMDSTPAPKLLAKDLSAKLQIAEKLYTQHKDIAPLAELLEYLYDASFKTDSRLSLFSSVSLLGIISALAWGLGYFGQPHILVRFMSIRSIKDIKVATIISVCWMSISLFSAVLIGILGIGYVNKFNLSLYDPEKIFIVMSQILFNPWVAGILLSAILAAIMSTASSQLLVSSATIAEDFYRRIFRKTAPEKIVMLVSRAGVLAVSLIAFILSTDKNSSVLSIVAYAWAGFGASFGSVMLFSLFWRRMTKLGAICGMLTGAIVVVVYKNFLAKALDFPMYEIIPGFVCASLAIIIVSLLQPLDKQTKQTFEAMLQEIKLQESK